MIIKTQILHLINYNSTTSYIGFITKIYTGAEAKSFRILNNSNGRKMTVNLYIYSIY